MRRVRRSRSGLLCERLEDRLAPAVGLHFPVAPGDDGSPALMAASGQDREGPILVQEEIDVINDSEEVNLISLPIGEINAPPVAIDDASWVGVDTTTILVTENDSDPDGDTVSVISVSAPAYGAASFDGASVTYTPLPGFTGIDTFSYTITDGRGGYASATVTADVLAGEADGFTDRQGHQYGDDGIEAEAGDSPPQSPSSWTDGAPTEWGNTSVAGESSANESTLTDAPPKKPDPKAEPPTSANLNWDHYQKVDPPKPFGAATVWANTQDVGEYGWNAMNVKKNGAKVEFTVKMDKNDLPELKYTAVFDTQKSYVLKRNVGDKKLFEHEKLHLQIAEYLATKAKANAPDLKDVSADVSCAEADAEKEAKKAIDAAVKKVTDAHFKKWNEISDAVQTLYDKETAHGTKAKEQAQWAERYKQFVDSIAKDKGWTK